MKFSDLQAKLAALREQSQNKPKPTNEQKRKTALAALSSTYQDDIEKLNRAWLAAAVNDGVNETAKKDVVLAQINTRKTQYATDRAAIIAQQPYRDWETDRKSTRLNSSHSAKSRMPSSA